MNLFDYIIMHFAFATFLLGDTIGDRPVSVREIEKFQENYFLVTLELTEGSEDVGFIFTDNYLELFCNTMVFRVMNTERIAELRQYMTRITKD
jgi:hypothetical protein